MAKQWPYYMAIIAVIITPVKGYCYDLLSAAMGYNEQKWRYNLYAPVQAWLEPCNSAAAAEELACFYAHIEQAL